MDRGEDRDLLSSGFFDGSHDRLYNKKTDGQRQQQKEQEKEGDRERKEREGREILLPFRCIQPYRCHVLQTKATRLVCHLNLQTDNFTNKITAQNLKERFDLV